MIRELWINLPVNNINKPVAIRGGRKCDHKPSEMTGWMYSCVFYRSMDSNGMRRIWIEKIPK